MHFVQFYGSEAHGFPRINVNHIARLEESKDKDGGHCYEAYDRRGERLGRVARYHFKDLQENFDGVIPECSGSRICMPWYIAEDDKVEFEYLPIVGWKVVCGVAEPVSCESLGSDFYIELCHGGVPYLWIQPEGKRWGKREDFEASVTAELREKHRNRTVKTAEATEATA